MGRFRVRVRVFNLHDEDRGKEVDLVVDIGATYPVIPRSLAADLGIGPSEKRTFTLADGTRHSRDVGWAGLSYDGRRTPSLVVLGEPDDVPRLGAFALEGLGFEVDPVAKTLRPAAQLLLPARNADGLPLAAGRPNPSGSSGGTPRRDARSPGG